MLIESTAKNRPPAELCFRLGLNIAGADLSIFDDFKNPEKGLDIDFDIDKTIDDTPNESRITIWNVSPTTYNAITKGTGLELYGGFGHDELALMFMGDVEKASQKAGTINQTSNTGFLRIDQGKNTSGQNDIPTIITCYDSGVEYQDRLICKSYKGLVSGERIIRDCINQMGLPVGRWDNTVFPEVRDYVARGRCVAVLKDLTRRFGLTYNINNKVFNLINPGQEPESTGIILNGDNSNRPVFDKFRDNGRKGWKIETALLPFLEPATYCLCDFGTLSGIFRVYRIHSRGNNYGSDGKSEIYVE